jgi:hypothetical protein
MERTMCRQHFDIDKLMVGSRRVSEHVLREHFHRHLPMSVSAQVLILNLSKGIQLRGVDKLQKRRHQQVYKRNDELTALCKVSAGLLPGVVQSFKRDEHGRPGGRQQVVHRAC